MFHNVTLVASMFGNTSLSQATFQQGISDNF